MGGDGLVQKPHRIAASFPQADKHWGCQNTTEIPLIFLQYRIALQVSPIQEDASCLLRELLRCYAEND